MKTGLRLPLQGETRQARSSLGASQPTRSELPGYRPVLLLTDLVPALGRAAKKGGVDRGRIHFDEVRACRQ